MSSISCKLKLDVHNLCNLETISFIFIADLNRKQPIFFTLTHIDNSYFSLDNTDIGRGENQVDWGQRFPVVVIYHGVSPKRHSFSEFSCTLSNIKLERKGSLGSMIVSLTHAHIEE